MTERWRGDAELSDCGHHRYVLWRWHPELDKGPPGTGQHHHVPYVAWVMLNPSTADAIEDDPTIRRVIGFTEARGFRRLAVVNLSSWRATDPSELRGLTAAQLAPSEGLRIRGRVIARAAEVVAAWGSAPDGQPKLARLVNVLHDQLTRDGVYRLGPPTKSGQPRHPLYLRRDVQWEPLSPRPSLYVPNV